MALMSVNGGPLKCFVRQNDWIGRVAVISKGGG